MSYASTPKGPIYTLHSYANTPPTGEEKEEQRYVRLKSGNTIRMSIDENEFLVTFDGRMPSVTSTTCGVYRVLSSYRTSFICEAFAGCSLTKETDEIILGYPTPDPNIPYHFRFIKTAPYLRLTFTYVCQTPLGWNLESDVCFKNPDTTRALNDLIWGRVHEDRPIIAAPPPSDPVPNPRAVLPRGGAAAAAPPAVHKRPRDDSRIAAMTQEVEKRLRKEFDDKLQEVQQTLTGKIDQNTEKTVQLEQTVAGVKQNVDKSTFILNSLYAELKARQSGLPAAPLGANPRLELLPEEEEEPGTGGLPPRPAAPLPAPTAVISRAAAGMHAFLHEPAVPVASIHPLGMTSAIPDYLFRPSPLATMSALSHQAAAEEQIRRDAMALYLASQPQNPPRGDGGPGV